MATEKLGSGPRNVFYDRLNQLLVEIEFDRKLKKPGPAIITQDLTIIKLAAKICRRASTSG